MLVDKLKITSIDNNKWLPNTVEDILEAEAIEVDEIDGGILICKEDTKSINNDACNQLIFKNEYSKECFVQLYAEGQIRYYKILRVETIKDYFYGTVISLFLGKSPSRIIKLLSQKNIK